MSVWVEIYCERCQETVQHDQVACFTCFEEELESMRQAVKALEAQLAEAKRA